MAAKQRRKEAKQDKQKGNQSEFFLALNTKLSVV
jgi:hypothetical protein